MVGRVKVLRVITSCRGQQQQQRCDSAKGWAAGSPKSAGAEGRHRGPATHRAGTQHAVTLQASSKYSLTTAPARDVHRTTTVVIIKNTINGNLESAYCSMRWSGQKALP